MISKVWEIGWTADSYPFGSAVNRCKTNEHGYAEREFLFSGTSNVYKSRDDGTPTVAFSDIPYTNRMVIRAPKNPSDFGGHVVIEILNASGKFDIERIWIISQRYFMNHGIVYVGITSKPDVFDALSRYDAKRYKEISWPNPRPETERTEPQQMPGRLTFQRKDQECGLFWDMLTDIAALFRSRDQKNPLLEYVVKYLTLSGWSQSSCYLVRYVNSFAYREETRKTGPVFDGYLSAGGAYRTTIPLNQEEYGLPFNTADTIVHRMEQPYIIIQTESEGGNFFNHRIPRADSDEPGSLCRLYEISGATHDNFQGLVEYYRDDPNLNNSGVHPSYHGVHPYPNNFPYDFPINAACHHLFRWIETGIAPPHCPRIQWNAEGSPITDAFGNAKGGARTAFVDVPTCRYIPWSLIQRNGEESLSPLFGHLDVFSSAFLKELYGSLAHYQALVLEATMRHVQKGFVLAEEAELLIAQAVEAARERGLE